MAESSRITPLSELRLSAEEREKVVQVVSEFRLSAEEREKVVQIVSEHIVANVYRELQRCCSQEVAAPAPKNEPLE